MSVPVARQFTQEGHSPFDSVKWRSFKVTGFPLPVEAPDTWSETAVEIAATKYFRQSCGENSVRQLVHRVSHTIALSAQWQGTVSASAAQVLKDEVAYILLHQIASFNSPVYFNVGIFPVYGFLGHAENFVHSEAGPRLSAYARPQASACFIQDVQDDLISIFDLLKSEAKLFKYGSGTGTNFSRLRARGEALRGGGESTGLISYLEIFDKAAQAIKSGGTTRRAAKMVVLDADHPEVMEFVQWKMGEERKARVLLANGYSGGMEGEAFRTVSGQNSNNSVSVSDDFMKRAEAGGDWSLHSRRDGSVTRKLPAQEVLRTIAEAAWECGDPGLQFYDTIQKWHTCRDSGPIRSSNPCSEYMFLDNSACNLSSLNLVKFLKSDGELDWQRFQHVIEIMLLAQEVLVDYSSYPTAEIARNSHEYRPLGLGYSNLGGLLMRMGIPYDSETAAEKTAQVTGAMHALALQASVNMAEALSAFSGWSKNRESAMEVLAAHQQEWKKRKFADFPWVDKIFESVVQRAAKTGLRNAQITLIAPTGTIGLLMDCDTLGIEPDFSLLKRKTLSGGGEMSLVNASVRQALQTLKYSSGDCEKIEKFIAQNGHAVGAPGLKPEHESVFDCALPPAQHPRRRVSAEGHLRIMAAAQPFLSGAISKTVNLPASTTVDEVFALYLRAWKLGLKSLAIYRDGSKALQPLCVDC